MPHRLLTLSLIGVLSAAGLTGCSASARGYAPPGQVQKETGYNPASGHVKEDKGDKQK